MFYSLSTCKWICNKEYQHVPKVLDRFKLKTIKDHDNVYLKCDGLSLADAFEKFKNSSLKINGLCLSHYSSIHSWSWDAILKMTKVNFELISDADICSLKNFWELEFLTFAKNITKHILNLTTKTKIETFFIIICDWFIWLCNVQISSNR